MSGSFYLWPPRSRRFIHPAVLAAHPPGYFDEDPHEPPMCNEGCGRVVLDDDTTCDHCLVALSESCGDWWPESIAAFRRLHPDPSL